MANEPNYSFQDSLAAIGGDAATWAITTPNKESVLVACIDDGFNSTHSEFLVGGVSIFTTLRNFTTGVTEGIPGASGGSHGTYTASIVAAHHNSVGMAGACPTVELMGLKGFGTIGGPYNWTYIGNAIRYAADHGAKVINMSFGIVVDTATFNTLQSAIDYAFAAGCVMVSGAGNDDVDLDTLSASEHWVPAQCNHVIAVGGVGTDFDTAWYESAGWGSNYGSDCVVSAPAENVYGLYGSTYLDTDGTSASGAFVAGAAAIIRSLNPTLVAQEVIDMIVSTADSTITDAAIVGPLVDLYAAATAAAATEYRETTVVKDGATVTISAWTGATTYYKFDSAETYTAYTAALTITDQRILYYYSEDAEYTEPVRSLALVNSIFTPSGAAGGTLLTPSGAAGGTIIPWN